MFTGGRRTLIFDSAVIHIDPPTGEITEEDSEDEEPGGYIHNLTRRPVVR